MAFRTKKISQMDPKGSNLASTDLLEISELVSGSYVTKSITGAEIIASVPPTTVDWGDIGGTLSAQTDLQTALNAKVTGNTAITGATKTKITYDSKGLVTSGTDATTADIADSINKRYVTDANLTVIGNTSGVNTGDQTLSGLGGVPTSRTLTINGTTQDLSADRTFTISTGITIGTTAITSGTVGRVLFEGTGNVVQESGNLFWDNTNGRLGIGTSSPTTIVHINGNTAGTAPSLQIRQQTNTVPTWFSVRNTDTLGNAGAISLDIGISGGTNQFFTGTSQGDIVLKAYSQANTSKFFLGATSASTAQMVLFPITGNVAINTTTDAGFKLDVNGTARVQNNFTVSNSSGAAIITLTDSANNFNIQLYKLGLNTYLFENSASVNFYYGYAANYWMQFNNTLKSVAIASTGTASANAASILDLQSTTKGFLPPRMTSAQRTAIATPATGLVVYQTDGTEGLYVNKSTGWALLL